MKRFGIGCLLLFLAATGFSQEEKKFQLRGYVKNMQTLLFFNEVFPDPST